VLLHAVIDAILGATGEGDIGEWFSDKDPKNKGIASKKMLEAVLKKIAPASWAIQHLDTTIFLEKPKLSPYKEKIRRSIAEALAIPRESVSVKAKTMEGLGPEGQGLAVSAEALVTMRRTVL
jgi:2-C-methyl-D-erythritol 2,4-cyclodiphosphate synthase